MNDELAAADPSALELAAAGGLLGPIEMQEIFRIKRSQFQRLEKLGEFDIFKVTPAIGPKCFSGVLVHRYITGQPVYEPTFGRKKRR